MNEKPLPPKEVTNLSNFVAPTILINSHNMELSKWKGMSSKTKLVRSSTRINMGVCHWLFVATR